MKKIIALLLCMLVAVLPLASCFDETSNESSTPDASNVSETASKDESTEESETVDASDDVSTPADESLDASDPVGDTSGDPAVEDLEDMFLNSPESFDILEQLVKYTGLDIQPDFGDLKNIKFGEALTVKKLSVQGNPILENSMAFKTELILDMNNLAYSGDIEYTYGNDKLNAGIAFGNNNAYLSVDGVLDKYIVITPEILESLLPSQGGSQPEIDDMATETAPQDPTEAIAQLTEGLEALFTFMSQAYGIAIE